jgi:hypothetical protein
MDPQIPVDIAMISAMGCSSYLFKYADSTDVALMLVGTIASLASGMSQVIMTIIFGQMVDAFGKSSPGNILHQVNKVQILMIPLLFLHEGRPEHPIATF